MLGGHSKLDPPDPFPNSEVKRLRADDSVHYACESRSPPGSYTTQSPPREGFGVSDATKKYQHPLPADHDLMSD